MKFNFKNDKIFLGLHNKTIVKERVIDYAELFGVNFKISEGAPTVTRLTKSHNFQILTDNLFVTNHSKISIEKMIYKHITLGNHHENGSR